MMMKKEIKCKVAIVGAGASGLMCGHTIFPLLKRQNISQTHDVDTAPTTTAENDKNADDNSIDLPLCILEARDRIGGRIHTLQIPCTVTAATNVETSEAVTASTTGGKETITVPIDAGAAWIHGTGFTSASSSPSTTNDVDKDDECRPLIGKINGLNPMMELLMMHSNGGNVDDLLNYVSPLGNPWTEPRRMHSPMTTTVPFHKRWNRSFLDKDKQQQKSPQTENCKEDNKNRKTTKRRQKYSPPPHYLAIYMNGKLLSTQDDNPRIQQALNVHEIILSKVSKLANSMKTEEEASCTSLLDALESIWKRDLFESGYNHDDGDDGVVVKTLVLFYIYLLQCWHSTPISCLSMLEFMGDDGDDDNCSCGSIDNIDINDVNGNSVTSDDHHEEEDTANDIKSSPTSKSNDNESRNGYNLYGDEGDDYKEEGDLPGPHCTIHRNSCNINNGSDKVGSGGGMEIILSPLLKDGIEKCIMCNQTVIQINHDQNTSERNIIITCSSGLTVCADICLVTIPLGCLKEAVRSDFSSSCLTSGENTSKIETKAQMQHQQQHESPSFFQPNLSERKLKAIEALKMSSYKKVLLTFDNIFWTTKEPFLGLVRNKQELMDDISFDDVLMAFSGSFDGENVLGNFLFLYNLWAKDGIPCLEAVLVGDAGIWSIDKSDETLKDAVLEFMEDAMVDTVIDGMQSKSLKECCVDCHVTRWEEDPFCRGAYSGFELGTMDWHCAELSRSEWDGRLIFAGEATHQEYEGSVHGALLSGVEAAKKIMSISST